VEAAVKPLGWEPERRPFQPHLTLGRVRELAPGRPRQLRTALLDAVTAPADPSLPVLPQTRVALVRSHLSPAGSRYEDLQVWELD
jgi:2'-5' RNA ligase